MQPPQALQQQRRRPRLAVLMAAPALLVLLAAVAVPTARASTGVANIQSIHGCDCIGICDRGSAGPHNTPTCYVNISSCNYLLGKQKAPMTGRSGKNTSAPFDKYAVPYEEITFPPLADGTKIAPATRFWSYCQDPTWVPRASNITTEGGCKCLELYQSAFGLLANVSCLGTETDRPFCYVKKGSCPKGFTPEKSDYYPNSAYSHYAFCQPYTQAANPATSQRTRSGCLCLERYRWYEQVINGGTCVVGQRQFPGRLRCFVDPKTCNPKLMAENNGPFPSVLYRDQWFDLCD